MYCIDVCTAKSSHEDKVVDPDLDLVKKFVHILLGGLY